MTLVLATVFGGGAPTSLKAIKDNFISLDNYLQFRNALGALGTFLFPLTQTLSHALP